MTSMEQLLPFPTAQDVLARNSHTLVSVRPDACVLEALQRMADEQIGCVLVMDGRALTGILSDRDCALRVALRQLQPSVTAVRDVMTTDIHPVPPETKIPECVRLMHEKLTRHLPVVRGQEVIGVLSVRDVMGALVERHERLLRRFREEQLTLLYPDPSSY
jgi:CBS domain-containing protein